MSSDTSQRQPLDPSVVLRLNQRQLTHRRALSTDGSVTQKMRLPAWAKISKKGSEGLEISMNRSGFEDRYDETTLRPKPPSLTKITIARNSGVGYSINLAITITVEFEVYSYEEFNKYAKAYLRRDQKNPIKLEWGNVGSFSSRGLTRHVLGGMYIVTGGYTTTPSNTFVCTFKAIAAAESIGGLSMFISGDLIDRFKDTNNTINGQSVGSTSEHKVKGLADIVNLHLLVTGDNSIINIPQDGYEVPNTSPALAQYLKGNKIGKVYIPGPEMDPNSNSSKGNIPNPKKGPDGQQLLEYVTLEYIIGLLQVGVLDYYNDELKRNSQNEGAGFKLKFAEVNGEEDPYSIIPTSPVSFIFKSCNPREVLFLGSDCGRYVTTTNRGQNFEVNLTDNLTAVTLEGTSYKIKHRKILISKQVLIDLLVNKLSTVNSTTQQDDNTEHNITVSATSERVLTVQSFLKEHIFTLIERASGGMVKLSLSIDPAVQSEVTNENNEIAANTLRIFDKSVITNKNGLNIWQFDPIAGDGNVFSLQLQADLPRDLLAVALYYQTPTAAGSANKESQGTDSDNSVAQLSSCQKVADSLRIYDEKEGLWPQLITSGFNAEKSNAIMTVLREIMVCISNSQARAATIEDQDLSGFMPVNMTIEMEGIFPVKIGNLFTSTNLPDHQSRKAGMAGICVEVTDVIEKPGIWTTSVRTIVGGVPASVPLANTFIDPDFLEDRWDALNQAINNTINNNAFTPFTPNRLANPQLLNDILNTPR
jgi:hypothetical protein